MESYNKERCSDLEPVVNSEIGFITRCRCCGSYNLQLGALTLRFDDRELHSLFYMLLKTIKSGQKVSNDSH